MKLLLSSIASLSCLLSLSTPAQTLTEYQQPHIKVKTPDNITWQNFDTVAKYTSQNKHELRYQEIKWKNTVLEAQQLAHKVDKPIIMILFFGDHRVNC